MLKYKYSLAVVALLLAKSILMGQAQLVNLTDYTDPLSIIPAEYTIENIEPLNSGVLDYSAVPYKNGVVFTSTRGLSSPFACKNIFDSKYSDLYYAERSPEGGYSTPEPLRGRTNSKFHDGVATFNARGTMMLFSRNNTESISDAGDRNMKIYSAELSKGAWGNFKELPFNDEDFMTCHPSLSADGNTLYFASNRTGGYGGMDLYKSTKEGESWSTPVNLGSKVNSADNEIFPFIDRNNQLFFASDRQGGYGGIDVYTATANAGTWGHPANLPAPINTAFDDFGYTSFANGQQGFLTSNREGGLGKDDLYTWTKTETTKNALICVIDEQTNDRIEDAQLSIIPVNTKKTVNSTNATQPIQNGLELTSIVVDGETYMVFKSIDNDASTATVNAKSCDVRVPVKPNDYYMIVVEKPDYEPVKIRVSGAELMRQPEFLIPMPKRKMSTNLVGVIKNSSTNAPIANAGVNIKNLCTNEELSIVSDASGKFAMELDCSCDYIIVGEKTNFRDGSIAINQSYNCDNIPSIIEVNLAPKPTPKPAPFKKPEEIFKGAVIQLDQLYYDFNKWNIRSDAAIELDKVVNLMKNYPSLEIELGSHTDSRGSDRYNQRLSQKRAESAVEYIISRGISSSRIIAKGYGERQLVNNCSNGVECDEEEHQRNRRTEIKVTAFDEKGVIIKD